MKVQVEFVGVGLAEVAGLREEYFRELGFAQELSVEVLVPGAECFRIVDGDVTCGYFIVHARDTLLEFHLVEPYWVFGECVFEQILARTPVRRAIVKSFDRLLFSSCVGFQRSLRVKGLLVRDLVPRELPTGDVPPYELRVATLDDLDAVIAIDQPVFRDPARLRAVISAGQLLLFQSPQGLLGFGITRRVLPGREHVELGIALDEAFRTQGLGVHLFRAMIEHCRAQGWVPVAGVAVENQASRAMGERVGMVARHRLLELTF